IGLETADRGRAPVTVAIPDEGVVPGAPARRDVTAAGEVAAARWRDAGITPWIAPRVACAQRVLELGLAGQAVVAAGLLRQPDRVRLGVAHAHVHHRVARRSRLAVVARAPVHARA